MDTEASGHFLMWYTFCMQPTKKERIVIVCAIFVTVLTFMIGRWYWYQADLVNLQQQAGTEVGIDEDGSLDH